MAIMRISEHNLTDCIEAALDSLKRGLLIAYPTETFYALGVKFDREESLKRIYAVKGRPKEKAMPLVVGSRESLLMVAASIGRRQEELTDKFWPGPLTLVFEAREDVSEYLTGGTGKVAVRKPGASFALALACKAPFPITATSANPSGMPAASDARMVLGYFGEAVDLIIDGGPTPGGLPSTIVDVRDESIAVLREGAVSKEFLMNFDTQ